MPSRVEIADSLERDWDLLCTDLKLYPLEISSKADAAPDFVRAVITSPRELKLFIAQLRASTVTEEEALNPTLIRS